MSNKKIGTEWENEVCELFAKHGWWAHFFTPDRRGAQPFDVLVVKNGRAIAIECKTVEHGRKFYASRLEDNQILAMEVWEKKTGFPAIIAVKFGDSMKYVAHGKLADVHCMDEMGSLEYLAKGVFGEVVV